VAELIPSEQLGGGGSCWRRHAHPCVCTHLADESLVHTSHLLGRRRCATELGTQGGTNNCSVRARDTIANALRAQE
jgi:hypothetical protein